MVRFNWQTDVNTSSRVPFCTVPSASTNTGLDDDTADDDAADNDAIIRDHLRRVNVGDKLNEGI